MKPLRWSEQRRWPNELAGASKVTLHVAGSVAHADTGNGFIVLSLRGTEPNRAVPITTPPAL
jgi:hypothetical protein